MRVLLTHEIHAIWCQGRYYNPTGIIGHEELQLYLHTIPEGILVTRCREASEAAPEPTWLRLEGNGIQIWPIPEFGLRGGNIFLQWPRLLAAAWRAPKHADRFCLRLPGPTGTLMGMILLLQGRKYGVEMVGHATESLDMVLESRGMKRPPLTRMWDQITAFLVRRARSSRIPQRIPAADISFREARE